jgi:flagellar hook protein FlgE
MASFSVPLSGLQASASALQVIGNNLANLNTDGFKDQTLSFGDIFSQMQGRRATAIRFRLGRVCRLTVLPQTSPMGR